METILKCLFIVMSAFFARLTPVRPLIVCAIIFIFIDFITGVIASRKRAQRYSRPWGFESAKAWTTIWKLIFVMIGIVLAWLIDTHILTFVNINLAKIFTGFVCGVEFWSYLENAADISNHPVFRWLNKFMQKKMCDALEANIEDLKPPEKNDLNGAANQSKQ